MVPFLVLLPLVTQNGSELLEVGAGVGGRGACVLAVCVLVRYGRGLRERAAAGWVANRRHGLLVHG